MAIKFNPAKIIKISELFFRVWLGYTLISNSRIGFTVALEDLGMPENIYLIIKAMWDTGFMMHAVKGIELLCGIMILFNLFLPLAILILFPVVINIYGIHIFLFKSYFTSGLGMLLICLYFFYQRRDVFLPLLKIK